MTRQERPYPWDRDAVVFTPCIPAPGEGGESREAKPLWEVPSHGCQPILVNREKLLIGRKTRQFLRKALFARFPYNSPKNPTPCKITLPKARETTMAEMGSHETELTKTISGVEHNRRVAAVNYARASVGLEGFSLSAADEEHAQRFINGDIDLEEFVQPRSALASPKA